MDQDRIPTEPKGQQPSNSYLKFGSFALQLLAAIGFAAWLGYRLDAYLSLKFPAFLLTFVLVVFAGMLYQAYKRLKE